MFEKRIIIRREYSDAEVIEGLQNNERDVERGFFRSCKAYFDRCYNGVMVQGKWTRDEGDIFQDSFLMLWQEIQARRIYIRDNHAWRIDKDGVGRQMKASLKTYLMAIAKNKNHERGREEGIYVPEQPNTADSVDEPAEEYTAEWIVEQCVNDLPPRCKDILTLFYYEGKSLDEILEIRQENQSKDGLKTGKSKCMKTLKKRIIEQFHRFNLRPYSHA